MTTTGAAPVGARPAGRTALVVRGGWEGHDPVAQTDEFLPFLRQQGFEVLVEESLEVYADPAVMDRVDLVVQCWTMGEILPAELRGLRNAVARGAGLAGWHGGIIDSFRMATDYLQMVGGQFAAHPHGIVECEVAPAATDHEVVAGLAPFGLHSEQYWVLTDPVCQVLATTTIPVREQDPWHQPVTFPAAWVRDWGAGRVFVCAPGHTVADLRVPELRTLIERGILWAARAS